MWDVAVPPEPASPPAEGAEREVAANPGDLRPFFGRAPVLAAEHRWVLRVVALGVAFEQYDIGLLNAALPQIARDLAIAPGDTGFLLAAIRLGGLGSVLLLPLADRLGRRRVFLLSILGMGLGTVATALSPTALFFVGAQLVTRVFLLTVFGLGVVILVEELPAAQRGAGLGYLSVLSGLGFGLASFLYAGVDLLPGSWRSLYAGGAVPLALLPFFRRSLRETRRFEGQRAEKPDAAGARAALAAWLAPVRALLRESPRRAICVGCAGALSAAGGISFFQYTSFFLQEAHSWAPGHYSLLVFGAGGIGILGSVVGGRGSDRFGRGRVGLAAFVLAPLGVALFYNGPAWLLVPAWALAVFGFSAGELIVRALAGELFPTAHRSTALGWLMLVQTVGWVTALGLVGLAGDALREIALAITIVAAATAAAGLFLLGLPETHRRELETIS